MVPATLHDFFIASASTGAALIGLLFVAVSIAPDRIFGSAGSVGRAAFAGSAFIALANCLFISMGALLPFLNIGYILLVVGISGLINTIFLIADIWQYGFSQLVRRLVLTVGSLAIYGFQIWWGIQLVSYPDRTFYVTLVTYALLGSYAIGLGRAWELVGGQDYSLISTVLGRVFIRRTGRRGEVGGRGDKHQVPGREGRD